ncbi:hypothetical protein [Micromonospora sp. DT31]|uniref:hypothetical protein n=1 Tax=Micromonospora sp. DT31 TaxID=3393434 RepID=UPI003CE95EC6
MRAILYDRYGPPDVLRIEDVSKPSPTGRQVLVKIAATSVNLSDWETLRGSPLYSRIESPGEWASNLVVINGERSPGTDPEFRTPEARMLLAEFQGDERRWRRLCAELEREKYGLDVMQAAFHLAVLRRFSGSLELREVTRFVREFNAAAPVKARVPPREAEAAIRISLGEEHLAESMDRGLLGNTRYALLFALVGDLGLDDDEIIRLLRSAEDVVLTGRQIGLFGSLAGEWSTVPRTDGGGMHWRWRRGGGEGE